MKPELKRFFRSSLLIIVTLIGLLAFFYPLLIPSSKSGRVDFLSHSGDALLFLTFLLVLIGLLVLLEIESFQFASKFIAILALVVATAAALRFVPLPLGASALFPLVILAGYTFGSAFGFLAGSLTMFVSSFFAGGFGPWVPFQMFVAGWVGATAAFIPKIKRKLFLLAFFGFIWGYLYGLIMNFWFWPFISGANFSPSNFISLVSTLKKYSLFYMATSFVWDSARALANCFFILLLGKPLLMILERTRRRFFVELR